jgi:peptidoglycan/LPS O-acetylase OafA/YrhL
MTRGNLFFVLSGFVITGLFLREQDKTSPTGLRSVYGNRSFRIFRGPWSIVIATALALGAERSRERGALCPRYQRQERCPTDAFSSRI